MSLIEEALRRQQEQERQRMLAAAAQLQSAAPPPAAAQPPPLPPPAIPVPPPAAPGNTPSPVIVPGLTPSEKAARVFLAVIGIAALCALSAGVTWWFMWAKREPAASTEFTEAEAQPGNALPAVSNATQETVAGVDAPATPPVQLPTPPAPPTQEVTQVIAPEVVTTVEPAPVEVVPVEVAPPPDLPAPQPSHPKTSTPSESRFWRLTKPKPATVPEENAPPPPEPWPAFTLKGRVAYGKSFALMMGNGEVLEVGDKTANGVQLVSASQDRIRLSYKSQIRDYQLKAGTFVLLPPEDGEP